MPTGNLNLPQTSVPTTHCCPLLLPPSDTQKSPQASHCGKAVRKKDMMQSMSCQACHAKHLLQVTHHTASLLRAHSCAPPRGAGRQRFFRLMASERPSLRAWPQGFEARPWVAHHLQPETPYRRLLGQHSNTSSEKAVSFVVDDVMCCTAWQKK
jgi:hypothetical protein